MPLYPAPSIDQRKFAAESAACVSRAVVKKALDLGVPEFRDVLREFVDHCQIAQIHTLRKPSISPRRWKDGVDADSLAGSLLNAHGHEEITNIVMLHTQAQNANAQLSTMEKIVFGMVLGEQLNVLREAWNFYLNHDRAPSADELSKRLPQRMR